MNDLTKTFHINSPTRTSFSFERKEDDIYFQVSLVNPLLHAYYLYGYVLFVIFIMFFDFYIASFFLLLVIPLIVFLNKLKNKKHLTDVVNKSGTVIGQLTSNLKEFQYLDLQTQKSYDIETQKYEILFNNEVFKIEYPKPDSDYTGFDIVADDETIAQVYYPLEPGLKGEFLTTLFSEKYDIPFILILSIIVVSGYLK